MSSSEDTVAPVADQPQAISKTRSRLMGLLVMAVILLPMMGAYIVFKTEIGLPTGTVNKGELLLPPRPIANLPIYLSGVQSPSGDPANMLAGAKKWRLLIPGRANCDKACEQMLYLTRQVHTRLAEKAVRVQRIYINLDAALNEDTGALIAEQHPGLTVVNADAENLKQFLADTNASDDPVAAGRYFLMDPNGFVMMAYTAAHSGNELLDDLKRLLKYSHEE